MAEKYQRHGYTVRAVNALVQWCFAVSDLKYLILTVDCANTPSCGVAKTKKKRMPIAIFCR
ncbi:MAG: GNAT family N-acetyltransferase [Acutalibacteraceae bacterium]|jgi:ribosomal-protein-alanine N-acetyltransferase